MTVSSVLIREGYGVQVPVCYTSKAFKEIEERYPMAKMTFALVVMTQ